MAPCRRAAAGDKAGDEGCGLRCGQGFVNLVGLVTSNGCTAIEAPATPAASSSDFDRPAWLERRATRVALPSRQPRGRGGGGGGERQDVLHARSWRARHAMTGTSQELAVACLLY